MASPPGDRPASHSSNAAQQRILSQFQGDWTIRLNVDQMFILIDGVLPFEACLYYQVLPLFLEGSRLNLGMVSPDDSSASDYVRRIISYLNYSLVPRQISSEGMQVVLTAYLNHIGKRQPVRRSERFSYGHHRHSARVSVTPAAPGDCDTLVVDSPATLNLPGRFPNRQVAEAPALQETPRLNLPSASAGEIELANAGDSLTLLSSEALLPELLALVLSGGIGRLYFECHPDHGQVLWSQEGVLQSVIALPPAAFQDLMSALKRMAHLPPDPVEQLSQAEVEYLYDRHPVRLRFRFMPSAQGEEATLQVLRGAALKVYQQQMMMRLEQDAMSIAQQLQGKLKEIRDRAGSGATRSQFELLPDLSQLLQKMENDLAELGLSSRAED